MPGSDARRRAVRCHALAAARTALPPNGLNVRWSKWRERSWPKVRLTRYAVRTIFAQSRSNAERCLPEHLAPGDCNGYVLSRSATYRSRRDHRFTLVDWRGRNQCRPWRDRDSDRGGSIRHQPDRPANAAAEPFLFG